MTNMKHQVKVLLTDELLDALDGYRRRHVVEAEVFLSRPEALRLLLEDATRDVEAPGSESIDAELAEMDAWEAKEIEG